MKDNAFPFSTAYLIRYIIKQTHSEQGRCCEKTLICGLKVLRQRWCMNTRSGRRDVVQVRKRCEHEQSVVMVPLRPSQRVRRAFVLDPHGTVTVESIASDPPSSRRRNEPPRRSHTQSSLMYVTVKQMQANKQTNLIQHPSARTHSQTRTIWERHKSAA